LNPYTDLEAAKAFHGHLGPNLVIGIKMGNHAMARLAARPHFGLRVEVECPPCPPVSCVMDGLQLATGCTMGKANLALRPADLGIVTRFTNTDTGESLTLKVDPDFHAVTGRWFKELGEVEASMRTWTADDSDVFSECAD